MRSVVIHWACINLAFETFEGLFWYSLCDFLIFFITGDLFITSVFNNLYVINVLFRVCEFPSGCVAQKIVICESLRLAGSLLVAEPS